MFLPDPSAKQNSFRTVLFRVCILFMSTLTGSRSILTLSLYESIIFFPGI